LASVKKYSKTAFFVFQAVQEKSAQLSFQQKGSNQLETLRSPAVKLSAFWKTQATPFF
jgi:hypothetical protein